MSKINHKKGFTLVELIVAIGVFSIVITVTSGIFIRSLRGQRDLVALIAADSNAQLALEQMAREMRTGKIFSNSNSEINFTNAHGENVIYRLNEGSVERGVAGVFEKITADNIEVEGLDFIKMGNNSYPPRITAIMRIKAKGAPDKENLKINLQTTVSSRVLE